MTKYGPREVPRRPGLFDSRITVKCDPTKAIEAYKKRMTLVVLATPEETGEGYLCLGDKYSLAVFPDSRSFNFLAVSSRSKRRIRTVVDTFLHLDGVEECDVPQSYLEEEWRMAIEHHGKYGNLVRAELRRALG